MQHILQIIGGFMFNPAGLLTTRESKPGLTRYSNALLYMCIISMLQGVAAFYMIFYPEPLYYGLGPGTPHAHLYIIEQSNPLLLAGLVMLVLIINVGFFHGIAGNLNFFLSKLLARKHGDVPSHRSFMACSGYALVPLLLAVPLAAFRFYFFGRIAFNNHDFPFFDMTVTNIVYLVLLGAIYAWTFVVQAKINGAMFDGLGWRASVPPIIVGLLTIALLAVIAIALPPVLNAAVYSIIDE
ncbi:MAG: hypothetical protein GYA24_02470 [Candidatus Lokiarchaeota archaeon]|nr:hypothetical protein [Candidatus Lokiarchaeota archaeon]